MTDFFNETAYVEITMLDDDKKLVCSMSIKKPAEAESILEVIRQNPTPIDPQFLKIAKDAVTTGVTKRKRDHLLLLTKNMIVHMSEFVQDGLQRFELMWEKSLLEHYKPLAFASVGEGSGYRLDGSETGVVSRVSVLVPVYFHAQGTCLFDRSRESKAASRISGVGISPGDMRVGRLADAFVFGALSILSTSQLALSQVFPELSDDLVRPDRVEVGTAFPKEQQYNEEGVYAVRFWRNNRSRVVVVDDYIPVVNTVSPCSDRSQAATASLKSGRFWLRRRTRSFTVDTRQLWADRRFIACKTSMVVFLRATNYRRSARARKSRGRRSAAPFNRAPS